MLSALFDEYETAMRASMTDMSPDQVRKWCNPKRKAIANLLAVVGDKQITTLTRDDALNFREWWQERVVEEQLTVGSANKDIGAISKMLRTIDDLKRLNIGPIFGQMRIEGEQSGQRIAYLPDFVQSNILAEGRLDGLNDEARRVLYLISETGLRLSEALNLTSDTINLEADAPFVSVRPQGRRMKTRHSDRDIPLVGVALAAMEKQPHGFPRYRDKGGSCSATVNKFLEENKLAPNGETAYSLRHLFEDRLTAAEAPEKLIAMLMGHKYSRPKYGLGPTLKQKQSWLQRIAFKPPSRV